MLGKGTQSRSDAHLMRPSDVVKAQEKLIKKESLAHVQTIIINVKQGKSSCLISSPRSELSKFTVILSE